MRNRCIDCPKCRAECAFLKKYGTPRDIALSYDPTETYWLLMAYECNLCGLCGAVCPVGLPPTEMFLEMRREAVDRGAAPLPMHKGLLSYEKRGTSRRFSWYVLPENCHTVFFPGCAFTGTRPKQTLMVFNYLKGFDPLLGMVLDCCCKPSHDLGRSDYVIAMMDELKSFLVHHGIKRIIVACPNCFKMFQAYGNPLEVVTVYEEMVKCGIPESFKADANTRVSIHDPCVVRFDTPIHEAVRKLAAEIGYSTNDMAHSRSKTFCCGEGGNVESVKPELADSWVKRRIDETQGRLLLTYCAGCSNRLNKHAPAVHILDAVLNPRSVISVKAQISRSPWTYFNRLRVKRHLKKQYPAPVCRERTYSPDPPENQKGGM
jgi:Fe-S oxidoreductase